MAKEPHLRQKDLRQPDEFQTTMARVIRWADANRSMLTIAAAGVVAVGAVVLVLQWNGRRQADVAARAFRDARTAFKGERFEDAAKQFETVATDFASTSYGALARLYRARALGRLADQAAAAAAYGEYLAAGPASETLRQDALLGMGRARERGGDATAALTAYTEAAGLTGPLSTDAALAAARLESSAGNAANAEAMYRKALAGLPDGDVKTMVVAKLPQEAIAPATP